MTAQARPQTSRTGGAHLTPLGGLAPDFRGELTDGGTFVLHRIAGAPTLLAFLGDLADPAAAAAWDGLAALPQVRSGQLQLIGVVPRGVPGSEAARANNIGQVLDPDGKLGAAFGVGQGGAYTPRLVLLDRLVRLTAILPPSAETAAPVIAAVCAQAQAEAATAFAPVLVCPRVFEPAFCQTLIETYRREGGRASGFMREIGGRTVEVHDPSHKRRADVMLTDQALIDGARARIQQRLAPMIERAFGWRPTRIERYLVARYTSQEQGFFRRHRDNTTAGTAHRKFAVTINLNAEDYEGGDLSFPEFGPRSYRAPTGGAVVFGCNLLHEAGAVTKGERFAFLPFLYDEAGARIRQANAHLVGEAGESRLAEPAPQPQAH